MILSNFDLWNQPVELARYIGLFWKSHQSRFWHLHMHFASRWFFDAGETWWNLMKRWLLKKSLVSMGMINKYNWFYPSDCSYTHKSIIPLLQLGKSTEHARSDVFVPLAEPHNDLDTMTWSGSARIEIAAALYRLQVLCEAKIWISWGWQRLKLSGSFRFHEETAPENWENRSISYDFPMLILVALLSLLLEGL